MEQIGERLKFLREELNLPQGKFAKSIGTYQTKIADIESGKVKSLSADLALEISKLYKINLEWLILAKGEMYSNNTGDDFIKISILGEVECTVSSNCYTNNENPESYIKIPEKLLKQISANIETSHIINVKGDSMEPSILAGDKVLADSSKKQVLNNKIYIIRIEDILTIKRLQKLPKGAIKVISDNKEYDSYTLKPDEDNYEVYAQVLWLSRYVY